MITLITGLPGNGKTLYALAWVKHKAEKEGRQVYYSGIADLRLPWIECDPQRWFELPKGAIVVVDEVQRVMRPRQHGTTVPEFVAKLETHRHLGVDLVFITQHPMLLDSNVRRLVGQHKHVIRKFGMQKAVIHEWSSVKDGCDKAGGRADSIRHHWTYPREVYGWYKSAELHTVKRSIPARIWFLWSLPLLIGAVVWFAARQVNEMVQGPKAAAKSAGQSAVSSGAPGAGSGGVAAPAGARPVLTAAQYVDQFAPRVPGLAYTAPAYDEVTKPVRAPFPAACVSMAGKCKCYTQQGTALDVPGALCESIVAGGFYVAWDEREPPERRHAAAEALERRPLPAVFAGGPVTLGGNRANHIWSQGGLR